MMVCLMFHFRPIYHGISRCFLNRPLALGYEVVLHGLYVQGSQVSTLIFLKMNY